MISLCVATADETRPLQEMVANVDCQVREFAQAGYSAVAGSGSPFPTILTILLTIYIAVIGYRMMLGSGPLLADTPILALKIGTVLAFTLQWPLFQTMVFDVAADGGRWMISIVQTSPMGGRQDPLAGAEDVHSALLRAAGTYEAQALLNPALQATTEPSLSSRLRGAARMEMLATAGVQSISMLLTGILTVIGPLFVALALFEQTRGLFIGWLRVLLIATLLPLLSGLAIILMLEVSEPTISALHEAMAPGPHAVAAAEAAIASVQLFSLAQAAIVIGVLVIVGGFDFGRAVRLRAATNDTPMSEALPPPAQSRVEILSSLLRAGEQAGPRSDFGAHYVERNLSSGHVRDIVQFGEPSINLRPAATRRPKPGESTSSSPWP
jgi:type IV secretion system protein VirB6